MHPDLIQPFRALQRENTRFRKVDPDQALDIAILKEAGAGNFLSQHGNAAEWKYGGIRL